MAQDQGNQGKSERGFASMDEQKQREVASEGGKAASQDRQHMAEIGREGAGASHGGKSSSSEGSDKDTRGGTREQHAVAGRQSHKNS